MHGYNIRECYTVRPGYVLICFDFSSCEVKILGALCKDPLLLKAIADGLDFHSFTACAIHKLEYEDFVAVLENEGHPEYKRFKKFRSQAKATTFGILYGSSVAGIAMNLGISTEEGEKLVAMYFETFPKIKEYVDNSHLMAAWNGYVYTPFGQRKMCYGALDTFRYTAVHNAAKRGAQNSRIQSTASTLGLICFAKLHEAVKKLGGRAICTVYDSVELEIPIRHAAEAIELGFYWMDDWPVQEFDWLDLPIGADAEIGFDWGNVHKVKRGVTQETLFQLLEHADQLRFQEAMR